jgi:hypothetical protein
LVGITTFAGGSPFFGMAFVAAAAAAGFAGAEAGALCCASAMRASEAAAIVTATINWRMLGSAESMSVCITVLVVFISE